MPLRSVNDLENATDISIPIDTRGWAVRTSADDEHVGSVNDVLVDENGTARYLDVDLGMFRKHVLVPVGQARADEREDVIWVHGMDKDSLGEIPEYDHHKKLVTDELERRLTAGYDRGVRARYHRPEYGGLGTATAVHEPPPLGTEAVRLRRLGELGDYEVADHNPDPRGWALIGGAGEKLGEVDDLVVDPQAMKARYLDVELDSSIAGDQDADHVLIPVGYARLEEHDRRVRVDALDREHIRAMPRFDDEFDESYEDRIDRHFSVRFEGDSLYRHPRYDADRLYGARAGGLMPGRTSVQGRYCDVDLRR